MKLRELIADQRFQVSIVVVVAFLRLVNLGYVDLQPYDESTYAIRAQTITHFGDWLDQTANRRRHRTTLRPIDQASADERPAP